MLAHYLSTVRDLAEHLDEGIVIADRGGKILYTNPAAVRLLGLPGAQSVHDLRALGASGLTGALRRSAPPPGADGFVEVEERVRLEGSVRFLASRTGPITIPNTDCRLQLVVLRDRTEHKRLQAVLAESSGDGMVSKDPKMLEIIHRVQQVAASNAFVMLQGESGTGKTELARMIHRLGGRAKQPFVEVNCAAIPESLIESELFGHVKGAFTGAIADRPGRFQAAHQGTLFLDEISELPLNLQAKLLKVLQAQEFEMVGSDESVQVDVRVISAANSDLRDAVDRGTFRADLYYRLAVIPLHIPPLRERPGDIPLLIEHFCEQLTARGYSDDIRCSPDSMRMMMDYPWPGNVRELANAVEHGIVCAVDRVVVPESLPQDIRDYCKPAAGRDALRGTDDLEQQRRRIEEVLASAKGSRTRAAAMLGVDRTTLWRRMQKLGMK